MVGPFINITHDHQPGLQVIYYDTVVSLINNHIEQPRCRVRIVAIPQKPRYQNVSRFWGGARPHTSFVRHCTLPICWAFASGITIAGICTLLSSSLFGGNSTSIFLCHNIEPYCVIPEKSPFSSPEVETLVVDEYEATWLLEYFREKTVKARGVLFGAIGPYTLGGCDGTKACGDQNILSFGTCI